MIRRTHSQAAIKKHLEAQMTKIHEGIISRLEFLGERCLIECRTNHTYMDQTGNLTSSMGYIITLGGKAITRRGWEGSTEGAKEGEKLAAQLSATIGEGYALIVVAGMNYAAAVEAKGFNVLSSAELLAERELPKMLAALTKNVNKL